MWFGRPIKEIFELRRELVWGILPPYNALPKKLEKNCLKALIASKPLEVMCTFEKEPRPISHFRRLPVGGSVGKLLNLQITISNSASDNIVEGIAANGNLNASEGIMSLYGAGVDVPRVSELLSAGLLGKSERRRIMPTKSSIVVVDMNVSNRLLSEVMKYPSTDSYEVYHSSYLDTMYVVLIMPGLWEHEQIKAVNLPGGWRFVSQRETPVEKPVFPGQIGGSYFPARLAVTEHLHKRRAQGKVLLFREVNDRGSIAAGAWQVRESLRHAFERAPERCGSLKDAL